jgi:hypothetical protein
MSIATMRNRVSTEFRKVQSGSDEYLELQAQRDPNDGRPVWEETSLPDAVEQSKRLESGNPLPTDIGSAQQPVGRITGATESYAPASSVNEPLPSEVEAGVEPDESASGLLPQRDEFAEEVPLTAVMESATDTDVSGTEPDLSEGKDKSGASGESGASGSKMKGKRSKKSASESDQAAQSESTSGQEAS